MTACNVGYIGVSQVPPHLKRAWYIYCDKHVEHTCQNNCSFTNSWLLPSIFNPKFVHFVVFLKAVVSEMIKWVKLFSAVNPADFVVYV